MCFGSSSPKNTKPPEPTPPTTFSYRAGAQSLQDQQRGVVKATTPDKPALGTELGMSAGMTSPYMQGDPGGAAY